MYRIYQQLPGTAEMALVSEHADSPLSEAELLHQTTGALVTVEFSSGGTSTMVATYGAQAVADPVVQQAAIPIPSGALSYADFLRLFTLAERVAIRTAALTNMIVADYMDLAMAQGYVKMTSEEAQQGIAYLAHLSLITPERAAEISGG